MDDLLLNPYLLTKPEYTPGKTVEEYQEQYGLEAILDMASNVNPLGPSPKAIHAVQQAGHHIHAYPDADLNRLRCKLARFINAHFDEKNIIVGNGSCDILRMAADVFLYAGGEAIIRRNAFPMYEVVIRRYGGECIFVETNPDHSFDVLSMLERITDRTRLIFLANPHNPTGSILPQGKIDEFLKSVPSSVIVICDHACQEYVDDGSFPDISGYILDGHNIIMTRTFSKIHALPGLRIGYAVAKKEIIALLRRTKLPFYNNTVSLMAASAALDDVEHVELSRTIIQEGRKYLYRQFDELGLSFLPTQSGSILLVDLEHDTEVIRHAMLRQGVLVLPAHPYHLPRAIRVKIGKPEENRSMVRALKQSLQELNGENL
jgi:histidinol-phosphate aminotransferase